MREDKIKFTNTSMWCLPYYGISNKDWKQAGLINAFLQDEQRDWYPGDNVYVLFRASGTSYSLIEDIITLMGDLFVDLYGYENELMVLVLKVPEEFEGDHFLIQGGHYSNLSPQYKDMVSDKLPATTVAAYKSNGKRLQLMIMEKAPAAKDVAAKSIKDMSNVVEGEIWEKFVIVKETLTKELINQLIND